MGDSLTERWVDVIGYEGLYSISTLGRVRSEPRRVPRGAGLLSVPSKILSAAPRSHGYRQVDLYRGNQREGRTIHSLLGQHFLEGWDRNSVVRHLNDNKLDLRLKNLAIGTHAENAADKVRNGNHHYAKRTHCKNNHELNEGNTRERTDGTGRRCITCANERSKESKRQARARLKNNLSADQ